MKSQNLNVRYNIKVISSLDAFADVRVNMSGNEKEVYFIRALGANTTYLKDLENMDRALFEGMSAAQCSYLRIEGLPKLAEVEDVACYTKWYEDWIASGRKRAGVYAELEGILATACDRVSALFCSMNSHSNASMEKNFVVKLLFWFDKVGMKLLTGWNPKHSMKFIIQNVSKKQEYLFCYLMTMFGVDVLLLQTETDIEEELEKKNLSAKFILGGFQKISVPKYFPERYKKEEPVSNLTRQRSPVTLDMRTVRKRPSAQNVQNTKKRETKEREMEFEELALLASSIVMITIHDQRGEAIGSGSGIMIGRDGYILTNNHVAAGGRFYSVRIEDDDLIYKTDEVIKYNPVLDLAIIRIDRRLNPLSVYRGEKKLARGQKVVAIGSPLGLFNSVSDGIISGFRKIDDVDMIQFTAPTSHGSSGGAVLNMMGEVIGISRAGIDSGQNLNLAVGYESIWGFIKGFT